MVFLVAVVIVNDRGFQIRLIVWITDDFLRPKRYRRAVGGP